MLSVSACFPGGVSGEGPPAIAGDVRDSGLIPGLERSPGGGHDNPLQCSCLENHHGQRSPWGRQESDTTERLSACAHRYTHAHTYTHTHPYPEEPEALKTLSNLTRFTQQINS